MALAGDTTAPRIRIERLIRSGKARNEPVSLPNLMGSLTDQVAAVLEALASET